tara:strand:- start:822 stop:974 length:153 start_codon:yes stop_codon:yes gene_type:complete
MSSKLDDLIKLVYEILKEKDEQINFLLTHNKYLKKRNRILERKEKNNESK